MNEQNPYEATVGTTDPVTDPGHGIAAADIKKIEAIVKDAGQFWLAILICILCSALGGLIIPIWYSVRLAQWGSFARKYPSLVAVGTPAGSLAEKFRNSRLKLILGIAFGLLILLALVAFYLSAVFVGVARVQQIGPELQNVGQP